MAWILYLCFPILCVLAIPPTSRPGSLALRLVGGIALYQILLFGIGTGLGLTRQLTTRNYTALTWGTALVLLALARRSSVRFRFTPPYRWLPTRRGSTALLAAILVALAWGVELTYDISFGTLHFDGLWYHIPRMMFWLQQHGFAAWSTPVWQQIGLPVGADVVLGQNVLLGNGWRGTGYVTCLLSVGAAASVYLVALDFRLSRWQAAMTTLLFCSFPGVGLRIWSVNSDIAAAFPVLASYVLLRRITDVRYGLALFLILNGLAGACKPTVAPLALLLGLAALWQCRGRIALLRSPALPLAGLLIAAGLMLASFWPVYATFGDFLGGDGGRGIKSSTGSQLSYGVAMSAGHWLLEPLGYLTPFRENDVKEAAITVYNALGARISELPPSWKPWPSQDLGRTGLASILLLPVLLACLPRRTRLPAVLLFAAGFCAASGMIVYDSYNARYIVVLLAGYALIWGAAGFFRRGRGRWMLAGLVTLNVCALLGVVSMRYYLDRTRTTQPGGSNYYISSEDRGSIARSLAGRPLLVITNESPDALLVGPDIEFSLAYLNSPADGRWEQELRRAATTSSLLALVHGGHDSLLAGPAWHRPGFHACSHPIPVQQLENALLSAGWRMYRRDRLVDLWQFGWAGLPSPSPQGRGALQARRPGPGS